MAAELEDKIPEIPRKLAAALVEGCKLWRERERERVVDSLFASEFFLYPRTEMAEFSAFLLLSLRL